jgi:hypothetical protein
MLFAGNALAGTKLDVVASCGADPTGVADSQPGIQSCLNSATSETAVYFPAGRYKIGSTLTVPTHAVTLYGDAYVSARLTFTGCGDLIKFAMTPFAEIFNGGVGNLWLLGDGHCAQTGIHIVDGSWMKVENVQISGFSDSTGQSVGIKTQGREGFHVRDARIVANYPIVLAKNPLTGPFSYLDSDHFHFENIYTTIPGDSQHWHITVEDGVSTTNTTIDGQNPMVGGCGILQWVSTTAPTAQSYHLKLANIRIEQMVAGCDRPIDIELVTALQTLVLDNLNMNVPTPFAGTGIYLRNVQGVTVRDTTYWNPVANATLPPATFIDAVGTRYIELQNNKVSPYGQDIVAVDDAATTLIWKDGPFRGKHCCYQAGGTGPWLRTIDSGILGQP